MSKQPEALRLADELADWSEGPDTAVVLDQAAAELRRLSEIETLYLAAMRGRHAMSEELLALTAQRDALLAALERIAQLSMSQFHIPYDMAAEACNIASAVIKAVEEGK